MVVNNPTERSDRDAGVWVKGSQPQGRIYSGAINVVFVSPWGLRRGFPVPTFVPSSLVINQSIQGSVLRAACMGDIGATLLVGKAGRAARPNIMPVSTSTVSPSCR